MSDVLLDIIKLYTLLSVASSVRPQTVTPVQQREILRVLNVYNVSATCYVYGRSVCCYSDENVVCSDNHAYAINKAIETVGQGIVFLRRGQYVINEPINLRSNIILMGEGARATVLNRYGNNVMIKAEGKSDIIHNIGVMNMRLYDRAVSSSDMVYLLNVKDSVFAYLTLSNFGGYGIHVEGGEPPLYSFWDVFDHILIESHYCQAGIRFDGIAHDMFISNITGGFSGVALDVKSYTLMRNIWYVGDAINIRGNGVIVDNIVFDFCRSACITINGGVSGIIITNGTLCGSTPTADIIRIVVPSGSKVSNVIIQNIVGKPDAQFRSLVRKEGDGDLEKILIENIALPNGTERYYGFTIDNVNIRVVNDFYM